MSHLQQGDLQQMEKVEQCQWPYHPKGANLTLLLHGAYPWSCRSPINGVLRLHNNENTFTHKLSSMHSQVYMSAMWRCHKKGSLLLLVLSSCQVLKVMLNGLSLHKIFVRPYLDRKKSVFKFKDAKSLL